MNLTPKNTKTIAIVGGGIVGLAHAYQAYLRGFKVLIFEKEERQIGASVRNFGLIWPIGQASGTPLAMALESRKIWEILAQKASFNFFPNTSLHLAYHDDEWRVLADFYEKNQDNSYQVELLTKNKVLHHSNSINPEKLKGGLWSKTEANVHPVEAVRQISAFLAHQEHIQFFPKTAINRIEGERLYSGKHSWQADKILICTGSDFEILFPEKFERAPLQKCKLQMMRTKAESLPAKQGPTLCAGLTLRHYDAFKNCDGLKDLDARYNATAPLYKQFGIHVLAVQNYLGEWVLGDTHEYGHTFEPFDSNRLNDLVLDYLASFFKNADQLVIKETWHGIYAKHTAGEVAHTEEVTAHTHIITGLGGAGMTLSFGLAAQHFRDWFGE